MRNKLDRGLVFINATHRRSNKTFHVTVEVELLEKNVNGYVRVKVVKVSGCERSMRRFFRDQVAEWLPDNQITPL